MVVTDFCVALRVNSSKRHQLKLDSTQQTESKSNISLNLIDLHQNNDLFSQFLIPKWASNYKYQVKASG